jgi:predicted amidohydrolase
MYGRKITAAVIQMSSTLEKTENFEIAECLIREAVAAGAELVALPELWSCHGLEEAYGENAEPILGPTTDFLGGLARELSVYVLGGSILEGEPGARQLFNTSTFFDPSGALVAAYRKIHLFDVKAPDREYVESGIVAPGREIVTAKAGVATLGLSVCYDLRFPELYRLLALRGAEVLAVPAAFTLQTGKDHWELLLRARAVENQAYLVAPAQWGQKADGRWTYGWSMIVDRPLVHGTRHLPRPRRPRARHARPRLSRPPPYRIPRSGQPSARSLRLVACAQCSFSRKGLPRRSGPPGRSPLGEPRPALSPPPGREAPWRSPPGPLAGGPRGWTDCRRRSATRPA